MCYKCYAKFRNELSEHPDYTTHADALTIMNIEEETVLGIYETQEGVTKMLPNTCNPNCVWTDSFENNYARMMFFEQ
jgi:hypothetical protein